MTHKLIVIGLDGATWHLIDPLIAQGRLPNLSRLRKEGASGVLQSCILPWTFPAWRVYASGRNPGKLGVFWFSSVDWASRRFVLNDANSYRGPDLWDYLNTAGLRTGVIDMPATYPPRPLDGFMVSGYPAEDDKPYTYPPELKAGLKTRFGYKTYAKSNPDDREAYLSEQQDIIRSRFAAARYLLDRVDFLHLTVFCIDQVQHRFWGDEGLFATWEVLDAEIGRFVTQPNFTYLFMSDHGFGPDPISDVFQLNAWLVEQGCLRLRKNAADMLHRAGLNKHTLLQAARKLGIANWLRRVVPENLRRAIPLRQEATGEAMMFDRAPLIDWEHSQALADGHGLIYFNPSLPGERKTALAGELRQKLTALRSPITGLPVAARVYERDEIYHGPALANAPDVILLGRDDCLIKDGVGGSQVFQPPELERWNAKHAPDGVFMAWGRHIQPGAGIRNASLIDLAPTILHTLGCAVPADMDGRVLGEIFAPESDPARRDVVDDLSRLSEPLVTPQHATPETSTPEADDLNKSMEERLRNLGYL
ncbi:MAG: alkaline phosphatase family protein [Anaerolineales bacterium]